MNKKKFKRFRKEWAFTGSLAFLTTCFIALVLFTAVIISNAEEVDSDYPGDAVVLSDISDYLDSQELDISDYQSCIGNGCDSFNSVFFDFDLSGVNNFSNYEMDCYVRDVDSEYNVESYHAIYGIFVTSDMLTDLPYIVRYSGYRSEWCLYYFCTVDYDSSYNWGGHLLPVDVSIVNDCVFVPANSMCIRYYFNSQGLCTDCGFSELTYDVSGYSNTWSSGGQYYNVIYYFFGNTYPDVVCSNISISGLLNSYTDVYESPFGSDDKSFYVQYGIEPDGTNIVLFFPIGGSGGDNTYPDGSGGDDTNNMYMRTADWQFNIPKYWGSVNSTLVKPEYTANWGKGNITFYGLINDYQVDNADHFNLVFNFYVLFQGHRFSDTQQDINQNFSKSFALRSVSVPLSDFINNNNSYTFSVSDIFNRALSNDNVNVNDYIQPFKSANSIDKWKWTISCDGQLQAGNYVSGNIQETYNFISQVSKEDSNTITENHNPYQPDPDNPDIDDDDGEDDDDYHGKGIHLHNVNNDNDTLTINNNSGASGQVVDDLVDKLVPANDGSGGLTDNFVELSNSNQWFSVMASALPWLGTDFWNAVHICYIAMLGILGVGLCIWILVHIIG